MLLLFIYLLKKIFKFYFIEKTCFIKKEIELQKKGKIAKWQRCSEVNLGRNIKKRFK